MFLGLWPSALFCLDRGVPLSIPPEWQLQSGQIALHGTNDPALLGTPASHGCVRMTNDDITLLANTAPPGTPVTIIG